MRLDLRDGQWVDLRERITHGQDKLIKRAYLVDRFEAQTVMLRQFIKGWNVLDPDGSAIGLDDADAMDRMPEDIANTVFEKTIDLYSGATVPNPPTPPSSGTSS